MQTLQKYHFKPSISPASHSEGEDYGADVLMFFDQIVIQFGTHIFKDCFHL